MSRVWAGLAALGVLLGGCASTEQDQAGSTTLSQPAAETESRQRARAFTDLATAYYLRGQYKIALDELRKAITVDPRFGQAYNLYGLIYMDLNEDRLAEENFRRALDLDRNDSEARNNYGWFLCTRGRHDAGQEQFALALRNPLYAQPELVMSNAGQCAVLKGDLATADAQFARALKLVPDNPLTLYRLAELRYRQGEYEEARRLLQRLDGLAAPSAESLWLGVRVGRRLGDARFEAARAANLRERFPDSPEARRLQMGQYE